MIPVSDKCYCDSAVCAFRDSCGRFYRPHLPGNPEAVIWTASFRTSDKPKRKCPHYEPKEKAVALKEAANGK